MPLVSILLIAACVIGFVALQVKKKRDQRADADGAWDDEAPAVQQQTVQHQAVQQQAATPTEPGWYADPWGHARLRYFDPAQNGWTGHVAA